MCLIRLKHPISRILNGPKADFLAISFVTSKRRRKREKLPCWLSFVDNKRVRLFMKNFYCIPIHTI